MAAPCRWTTSAGGMGSDATGDDASHGLEAEVVLQGLVASVGVAPAAAAPTAETPSTPWWKLRVRVGPEATSGWWYQRRRATHPHRGILTAW